ncbi:RIP metalloprotease RseP [Methylomonas montana]|uniref:RIP metalloprotease RseP n=1 Tax=Methylomonas montana TaxID=3058963 RepID=UPI0026584057|nr:RIP metalloprotease RseP [Methylomonas montana]WKJ92324.1 RIP metalloprotease RseP [Methylomonas montana]
MDTLHTLFYFIVAIAVLVAFHEFGHFWVARKVGVKVIRFSIGFGKPLWTWQKTPNDTEFVVAAIPLGGYVKMVDEREEAVNPEDLPYAFNRQPLLSRTAVVAAGPVFNLLLAVVLFWSVLVIGEVGVKPLVGGVETGSLAEQAGFVKGDEILSVNDTVTPTWIAALDTLLSLAIDGEYEIRVLTKAIDDSQQIRLIQLSEQDVQTPETLHKRLGLKPWMPTIKPIIGKLLEDGVAKQAGLQSGDLIVSADGAAISDWQQWVDYVQARPDVEIKLLLERNGAQLPLSITPRKEQQSDGKAVGKIGAGVDAPKEMLDAMLVKHALSPWDALPVAGQRVWFYAVTTLKMMGKMLVGSASVNNLSGPISIAQYAGQSADMGLTAFLKFLGLVSVSLGVLNLLPVPVLDGGHLLFFAIEAIKGSPIPEKMQLYFQQAGMLLLMLLMALAMFLDIDRLFQ